MLHVAYRLAYKSTSSLLPSIELDDLFICFEQYLRLFVNHCLQWKPSYILLLFHC